MATMWVLYSVWYSWCLSYREPGFTVLQAAWYRGTGLSQHHNHHRPLWFWKGKDRHLNSACFYTLLKSRLFVISLKTVIMVSPPHHHHNPKRLIMTSQPSIAQAVTFPTGCLSLSSLCAGCYGYLDYLPPVKDWCMWPDDVTSFRWEFWLGTPAT